MIVVTNNMRAYINLEVLVKVCLGLYDLFLPPGDKGLKGVLEKVF